MNTPTPEQLAGTGTGGAGAVGGVPAGGVGGAGATGRIVVITTY